MEIDKQTYSLATDVNAATHLGEEPQQLLCSDIAVSIEVYPLEGREKVGHGCLPLPPHHLLELLEAHGSPALRPVALHTAGGRVATHTLQSWRGGEWFAVATLSLASLIFHTMFQLLWL